MNNENNVQTGIGDAPAQKDTHNVKNSNGRSRVRRDISAEAAHILKFLNSCTQYQADAVRVMVAHVTGDGKSDEISQADRLAVNRFLNHGMNKGNTPSVDAVMKFRVGRSEVLMKSVRKFCGQDGLLKATLALMRITTDTDAVRKAFDNLPEGK